MTRHPIPGETWRSRATHAIAEIVECGADALVLYRRSEPGFPHAGLPWCMSLALFLDAFAPPEEHRDIKPESVSQSEAPAPEATSSDPAARLVLYVACPLRPTEQEVAAEAGHPEPETSALMRNLNRAMRWLAWLRRSFPETTFIAPWIVAIYSGENDADPAQREAGLVDADAVVARCDGVVLCGGRVSSGMARERAAARRVWNLTWCHGPDATSWVPRVPWRIWAAESEVIAAASPAPAAEVLQDACRSTPTKAQPPAAGAEILHRFQAVDLATAAGRAYSPDPRGLDDDGARTIPPRPCCRRIGEGWCFLDAGHEGMCITATRRPLPVSDFGPRRARR